MTSHLEIETVKGWIGVKTVQPGDESTFTNYQSGEARELYAFKCSEDDRMTAIRKAVNPGNFMISRTETFVPLGVSWELVTELSNGEEFPLSILSQGGQQVNIRVVQRTQSLPSIT